MSEVGNIRDINGYLPDTADNASGPKGIGGWLIFPMLGTVVAPWMVGHHFLLDVTALNLPGTASPGIVVWTVCEGLFNLALLAAWIVAVVLLFQHKKAYPKLFVALCAVCLVGPLVDISIGAQAFNAQYTADHIRSAVQGPLLWLIIGVPYMLTSKRVRNTFVQP
jgi:uncharacterized protein DUF2569